MRRAWSLAALLGAPLLLAAPPLSAQTTGPNGLRLDFQTGIQVEGAPVDYFQAARVLLDRDESLVDGLDLRWGGEALWMAARGNPLPPWPQTRVPGRVGLEWDNAGQNDGVNLFDFRVTRLCLKGRFDRLQAGVGLQDMGWGQGWFYRPTDYFEPLGPLAFWREEPLGSESLDLSQPLFDELVLEAAARATAGGGDWVVRLPNETLAYALTPSLARLGGRMVLGLEARLTLPVCQLRLEGARWDGGDSPLEMEAGLSTRWDGSDLCLEWLRDATGEALGEFSGAAPGADYLYFSWGRALGPAWRLETRLVKSPDGGPFLLWPKAVMDFGTGWQFSLEGRTPVAWSAGPLARVGARLFTALAWEF